MNLESMPSNIFLDNWVNVESSEHRWLLPEDVFTVLSMWPFNGQMEETLRSADQYSITFTYLLASDGGGGPLAEDDEHV